LWRTTITESFPRRGPLQDSAWKIPHVELVIPARPGQILKHLEEMNKQTIAKSIDDPAHDELRKCRGRELKNGTDGRDGRSHPEGVLAAQMVTGNGCQQATPKVPQLY
jgi:hypothetical protein